MLSSPITVTVDGTAHVLPRIQDDNRTTVYRKVGTGFRYDLTIRHSVENGKLGAKVMERHNVDFKYTTWDVNGVSTVYQVYTVVRTPEGADPTIVEKMWVGFNTFSTANDGPIIGGEG